MGVDAMLAIHCPRMEPREILRIAYKAYRAYRGYDILWIADENDGHCIEEMEQSQMQYMNFEPGNEPPEKPSYMWLDVGTLARWYGEGYERGPIVLICSFAEWVEHNIPGSTVYYGKDSSMSFVRLDSCERKRILEHFYNVDHEPYRSDTKSVPKSVCPRCDEQMSDCGGHGDRVFMKCFGCELVRIVQFDGKVLAEQYKADPDWFHKTTHGL